MNEDMCDFKIVGGTIKLKARPSNSSNSSISKRHYLTRFYSRPSSAIPRLYSEEHNLQDDLPSIKNDHRPYSADCIMQNLVSGKSKETLTDGSFESIYVPVDLQLPSSNLYKELLDEDIENWKPSTDLDTIIDKEEIKTVEPTTSYPADMSEPSEKHEKQTYDNPAETSSAISEVSRKSSTESMRQMLKDKIEELNRENEASKATSESMTGTNNSLKDTKKTTNEEDFLDDKYVLTPGLTSKPPLPKKISQSNSLPSLAKESEVAPDNAIYGYFAIKYNFECEGSNFFNGIAEKPMCDYTPEKVEHDIAGNFNVGPMSTQCRKGNEEIDETKATKPEETDETTNKCTKNVEVINEQKEDEDFDLKLTLSNWLEEINSVQEKESETDKYMKEVIKQCKSTEAVTFSGQESPLLSEINIDELFRMENVTDSKFHENNENHKNTADSSPPSSSKATRNQKELDKTHASEKTSKTQYPVSSGSPPTKMPSEKISLNSKNVKQNKYASKAKFVATPIKLHKANDTPRQKVDLLDENVETWMGTNVRKSRKNRAEFTDLINQVEDLQSTTELITTDKHIVQRPQVDDNKQENFDEIETIIEALEQQDKTSQNNIKTMKKMVTSELSNSLLLNEGEQNLSFKKRKKLLEDSPRVEIISDMADGNSTVANRNGSELSTPTEFDMDSNRSNPNEKSNSAGLCKHYKMNMERHIPQAENRRANLDDAHACGDFSKPPICNSLHNYKELLSYLDEVDKKCTKTLEVAKERAHTASKLVLESTNLFDTMPKVEDLLTYTPEELSSYIIDLSLRVKDKSSCIGLLQNELATLREKVLTQSKQAESNLRHKLKEQKEETERITKRHQKFIDQLMEEKKTLARRCEELVEEMTVMEDKYVANMKAIEHKHQVEMHKMKDMHTASEKLRRERWIEGRTQKIKEMAVKSIEPEVERMEKRQLEELSNIRQVHKREIEEIELRAARKLQEHSENLREQLVQDREKALAHERDVMRLRYEKLVESEERNYQEQRRRLLADHANRLAECEEREGQAVAEKERGIKQAHEEFEEKLQAAVRRHANETKLVKETAAIEMENWKNTFRKQQSALLMEKETSIRRECRKERDREIEVVIERLENESNKSKTQMEQTTENRLRRIRDKYELEMRDLEMLEKDAQNKYCEARSKLLEYEEVILTLRTSIKQLETQLTQENLKRSKLEMERDEVRQTIRKEYEDKVQGLEKEVEELKTSADKQVEQLYSRVRVSLARKDELLSELTTDHKALKEKCAYLENMMEQQRKEFMINS